jgi:hypothetical protein
MLAVRATVLVLGAACILSALISAIRTFIVPRGLVDRVTWSAVNAMRFFFVPLVSPHQRMTPEMRSVDVATCPASTIPRRSSRFLSPIAPACARPLCKGASTRRSSAATG